MSNEVDFAASQGLAKRVYDEGGVKDFLPKSSILTRDSGELDASAKTGEKYLYPVVVKPPNGVTYGGTSGGVTALKGPRNMVIKQAEIAPYEMVLREQASWAALARMAAESKAAFAKLQTTMQMAMKKSLANRLEINLVTGQRGLGVVSTITDNGSNLATIVFTEASWRPGMWNALDVDTTLDSFASTVKQNSGGALVVKGITRASRAIQVLYVGSLGTQVNIGDVLYFEGAWDGTTYSEAPGFMKQAAHVSGLGPTNINVSTYPSFQGNAVDVAGPFSTDVAEALVGQLRDRGAEGTVRLYLANKTYGEIANEVRANNAIQIAYNASRQKFGTESFTQNSKDVGPIEYVNHPFMAWGEAFIGDPDDFKRGGSSDIVPTLPGTDSEKLFRLIEGYTAAEYLMYSDQFGLLMAPAHALVATGITHPT